jgi:hypothetical protein
MGPLSDLGDEYAHVYVPCIPAPDLIEHFDEAAVEGLPEVLRTPLIKVRHDTPGVVAQGIRSGGTVAVEVAASVSTSVPCRACRDPSSR